MGGALALGHTLSSECVLTYPRLGMVFDGGRWGAVHLGILVLLNSVFKFGGVRDGVSVG